MEEPHKNGGNEDIREFSYKPPLRIVNEVFSKFLTVKPRDSIASQMEAMEIYEMKFGIQKGDGTESPIALATMKTQTDFSTNSEWERTLRVLMRAKLHNYTGLNIMELLDLPHALLVSMLDVANSISKSEAPHMRKLEEEAKQAGLQLSKQM